MVFDQVYAPSREKNFGPLKPLLKPNQQEGKFLATFIVLLSGEILLSGETSWYYLLCLGALQGNL